MKAQTGGHEYSSTLSLTSALDGVEGKRHTLAVVPRGRDPVPIVQEAGWAPGPVWRGADHVLCCYYLHTHEG